jgi:hypothetical protein
MSQGIDVMKIVMLPDGFKIEIHPLVVEEEGAFVRDRLVEMLPAILKQLKDPDQVQEIPMDDGNVVGVLWPIQTNSNPNKKAH